MPTALLNNLFHILGNTSSICTMLTIMTNVAMNNKAGVIGGVTAMLIITLSIRVEDCLYVFARVFETLLMSVLPWFL